jgi:hypothetical protein
MLGLVCVECARLIESTSAEQGLPTVTLRRPCNAAGEGQALESEKHLFRFLRFLTTRSVAALN